MDADQIEVYLRKRKFKSRLEEAYANHLNALVAAGEVHQWHFESVKFRMGVNTWYMPDFRVVVIKDNGEGEIHYMEVKGSWNAPHQDKSRVKLKTCTDSFHGVRWFGVTHEKDKGWVYEEIK